MADVKSILIAPEKTDVGNIVVKIAVLHKSILGLWRINSIFARTPQNRTIPQRPRTLCLGETHNHTIARLG
jgi:hypothetical protein